MRISAGQLKGKRTAPPKIFTKGRRPSDLRPTSSKVREALFDILRGSLEDSCFLDLYAGTGTVGLEALSRGAAKTHLVEADRIRVRDMTAFIAKSGLYGRAFVHNSRSLEFLKKAERTGLSFDIIFADPPYASGEIERILPFIDESDILNKGGFIIIEHSSRSVFHIELLSVSLVKQYRYGDTMLSLYRKEE